MIVPTSGATVTGATTFDATASSNTQSVAFDLAGGVYGYGTFIGSGSPTIFGWVLPFDTSFLNGSYAIYSVASNAAGSGTSSPVGFNIRN